MVRADLEGLVAAHDEADLARLLVLQQANLARPAFLPLVRARVEAEQFCAPVSRLLIRTMYRSDNEIRTS